MNGVKCNSRHESTFLSPFLYISEGYVHADIRVYILYRSKFSRGSNFRYFREVPLIRENKNLAKISVLSK